MPSVREVTWAKFRVAAMIGSAIGILLFVVYLLVGGADWLAPAVTVRTYMVDLSGLRRGSPVRFNGIHVGQVTAADLSHLPDPKKVVRVDLSIMQRYLPTIPDDSTVAAAADNVLGDKFANISEGKSSRHLQPDGELQQTPPSQITTADLIKAAREILSRIDTVFTDIEAGRGEFGELVKSEAFYNKALAKVTAFQRQMRSATAKDTMAGRLIYDETLYDQLRAPIKRLDDRLREIQAGQGAGGRLLKDSAQYDQLRKSVGDLGRALEDLRAGKGRAGKLLRDDEAYMQIKRMAVNLNDQLDALNASQLMASTNLYDALQGSTRQLQDSLKQFRANPKKYLWLKLF
jgi:phospholipid/cholesterol/gamma-HCH transport system substrate-binding protein